ncbi:MAG: beta-lactamase family protein [Acidimicrobiales bacterium]|nr:beta-lactamase family protein [Acidimicrobiales bacterium]
MLDDTSVSALLERVRREVDDGLLPSAQVAVALDGEVVLEETYGAPAGSRYVPFSCTKAIIGSVVWQLVGEGAIDLEAPVVEYVPAFGTNGKEAVTVEQVLMHVGGFPYAPLGPGTWETRESRHAAFSRWRLTLTPGETFMYHPTAAHWVVADIVEEVTGQPYADALQQRITDPLGLPRLLAIPHDEQDGIVDAVNVGDLPTEDEVEEAFGMRLDLSTLIPADVSAAALLTLNDPDARAVGVPGGGGVVRARDLALLYQAFLHDPEGLWDPAALVDATATVRNQLPDMFGVPANRTRGGLVVRGDDGMGARRGMGHTASPRTFGHNGAGGQIAFADPDTGLSFVYLTNGMDQNMIREHRRTAGIASRAAQLVHP